jgi:hypothetical protein
MRMPTRVQDIQSALILSHIIMMYFDMPMPAKNVKSVRIIRRKLPNNFVTTEFLWRVCAFCGHSEAHPSGPQVKNNLVLTLQFPLLF